MSKTNISHFPIGISPVHINYRLYGSIPKVGLKHIQALRQVSKAEMALRLIDLPKNLYTEAYTQEMVTIDRAEEGRMEHFLHHSGTGPMYLDDRNISELIIESLKFLHARREIVLYAVCVMSNHVHVILSNCTERKPINIGDLMSRHKTFTAGKANGLLGRKGNPFWAAHYFDRTIRDGKFLNAMWYVLLNPVKARLVGKWEVWAGTYVNPEFQSHFVD